MELNEKNAWELLHLLMDMGEKLYCSGAEVNRVEDTLNRMGRAYGATDMNVFVITSSIVVTLQIPDGKEITQTRRISGAGSTDFRELERLNRLSRMSVDGKLSLDELRAELEKEPQVKRPYLVYVGSALAAGAFAVFFGGGILDGVVAALFGLIICLFQKKFQPISPNPIMFNIVCSFIIGAGICLSAKIFPLLHMDKIMIGDIMLLIPGIAMTNAIRDIITGDTVSGTMRLVESTMWAGALAGGFMSAIWLIGG